jgi:hypothetical protein
MVRLLSGALSPSIVVPLGGAFFHDFMYSINATVGTPPTPVELVFDTGSSDLIVPTLHVRGCRFVHLF